jgi:hypothetical protein
MTGLFVLIIGILFLGFLIWALLADEYDNPIPIGLSIVAGIFLIGLVVCIPISRIDNKANIQKVEQLRLVIEDSREKNNLTDLERLKLIETITSYNSSIANWKIKGNKWYNNKWYYVPESKDIEYLK